MDGPHQPKHRQSPTSFEKGRGLAYLGPMAMPRPSRPSVVWADFKAFVRQPGSHKFLFAALAIIMPVVALAIFMLSPVTAPYKPPDVIFAEQWPANRSEAEVRKQLAIDAPKEREQRRLEAEAIAEHKRQLRKLADALGMDVDAK